jgi:hypothetical protein
MMVGALLKDVQKSLSRTQQSSVRGKRDSDFDLEAMMRPFIVLFILYGMVFIPFVDWFNTFANGIDSFWVALWLTLIMVGVSALGAHFQLTLFFSYLLDDQGKVRRVTKLAFVGFYLVLLVNVGLVNTISDNEQRIKKAQQSIDHFNHLVQD